MASHTDARSEEASRFIMLIKRQLARTEEMSDRRVTLTWPSYILLLEYRGIEWRPHDKSLDAKHDDRPIKTFDGFPLYINRYSDPNSRIEGRRPDGMMTALAIPPL